jgi:sortase A
LSLTGRDRQSHHYEVVAHMVVDSDQEALTEDASELLLVTCYPFDAISPGGGLRYIVKARLIL